MADKKKQKVNLRDLASAERESRLAENLKRLAELRLAAAGVQPLKNPMEIRKLRREIARLLTLRREEPARA